MQIVVPEEFQYLYERSPARPVVKIPDEVLRKATEPVTKLTKRTEMIISDLIRIMKLANGVGLAAPQIGVSQRIFVMAPEGSKPLVMINPVIIASEGEYTGEEGCLSIPGLYGDVTRPEYVKVHACDRKGREFEFEFEGMYSKVFQHEFDHLEGTLFIDKVKMETLHWAHPEGNPTAAD